MNLATFFFGIILDKYGSFCCRFWCILILTIGLVILMFVPEIEWFLLLGIILYSAPTFTLLMTNHQLAALFPKGSRIFLRQNHQSLLAQIINRYFQRAKLYFMRNQCFSGRMNSSIHAPVYKISFSPC